MMSAKIITLNGKQLKIEITVGLENLIPENHHACAVSKLLFLKVEK